MASNTEINTEKKNQLLSDLDYTIAVWCKDNLPHGYFINLDIIKNYQAAISLIDLSQNPSSITWPLLELRDDNIDALKKHLLDQGPEPKEYL